MWTVEYTRKFLKELAALPIEIQSRIEPIVFEALESVAPFELGYLEKMKGYSDKYKIRIGDYRVGITLDKKNQTIFANELLIAGKFTGYFLECLSCSINIFAPAARTY